MNGKVKNAMAALLLVAAPLATQAKQWSLKDCIDYALANNIALQKTQLTKASAQEDYLQSKAALLPSLSASTNQSVNYTPWVASGISGDGFSRASIDKVYYNGNYSVMGNYTEPALCRGCTARFGYPGYQIAGTDCAALRADSLLYRGYPGEQGELSLEPAERRAWQGDGEDRQDESG